MGKRVRAKDLHSTPAFSDKFDWSVVHIKEKPEPLSSEELLEWKEIEDSFEKCSKKHKHHLHMIDEDGCSECGWGAK